MDYRNTLIGNIFGIIGTTAAAIGGLAYLLDREPWQAVICAIGILLMLFGLFAYGDE